MRLFLEKKNNTFTCASCSDVKVEVCRFQPLADLQNVLFSCKLLPNLLPLPLWEPTVIMNSIYHCSDKQYDRQAASYNVEDME